MPGLDAIGKALAAARAEFRRAEKDAKNEHLKNRYATLASVIEACDPALAAHGLTFIQPIEITEKGPVLKTVLIHAESGQTIESECPLLFDQNSKINPMQAMGSAISYARRYSIASLLGVLTEDDDGQGAYPQQRQQQAGGFPNRVEAPRRDNQPKARPGGFWEWCQAAGENKFELLNHLAKALRADGMEVPQGNRERIRFCGQLWDQAEDWKEWFRVEASNYTPSNGTRH